MKITELNIIKKIEIISNIINYFTVTFDQFNAYLLNFIIFFAKRFLNSSALSSKSITEEIFSGRV